MDILPLPDGGLRFLEVPTAFYEQLSLLSQTCDPNDDPTIVARLYPHPLDPNEEPKDREKAEEDWSDFVRPELEAAFDTHMLTVMNDLAEANLEATDDDPDNSDDEVYYRLEIPSDHTHAWFQVLNRARIVLAMKHRLPLSEHPLGEDEEVSLQRLLAAHLSDSFAEISEILVHLMTDELS